MATSSPPPQQTGVYILVELKTLPPQSNRVLIRDMGPKVALCIMLMFALALDIGLEARGEGHSRLLLRDGGILRIVPVGPNPLHNLSPPPNIGGLSRAKRILHAVPGGPNPIHNQTPPPNVEGLSGTERILREVPGDPNLIHHQAPPPSIEGFSGTETILHAVPGGPDPLHNNAPSPSIEA